MKDVSSMALYAVDVRDRVIQRVSEEYSGADNLRVFLIEADSAKASMGQGPPIDDGDQRRRLRILPPSLLQRLRENALSENNSRITGFVTVAEETEPACTQLLFKRATSWFGGLQLVPRAGCAPGMSETLWSTFKFELDKYAVAEFRGDSVERRASY